MKRTICLTLALVALTLSLTSCSLIGGGKNQAEKSAPPESSQSAAPDQSGGESGEEKVVQVTINKIGTYLVLLTEDGEYQVMDFGEDVQADEFAEGDKVTVTYTGELGSDTSTPVIVSMEKEKE